MDLSLHPYFFKCSACVTRESDPKHAGHGYCTECRKVRCACISLDRFCYNICEGNPICLLQDEDDGLFLARVNLCRGQEVVWLSLQAGEYPVWRSDWTISVSESNRDNWTFMSGINYLHATPFVPLKAFRKLKMIVRLLKIARGVINQLSPFCFCGGREVLRLSQTASPFRGLIEDVNIRSFGEVVSSLACSR